MPVEMNHTEIKQIEWNVNDVLFNWVSVVQMVQERIENFSTAKTKL